MVLASSVWRDFNTEGVPGSGVHDPLKATIRQWALDVEAALAAAAVQGGSFEVGNASDTTLARAAAGVLSVEGQLIHTLGNLPAVSTPEAEAGAVTALRAWAPDKIAEAIAALGTSYTQLPEQATGSGTLFDFTIPSGATQVDLLIKGCSTVSTDNLLVQLGDAGGIEGSGYVNYVFTDNANVTNGAGFPTFGGAAVNQHYGIFSFKRASTDGAVWIMAHNGFAGTNGIAGGGLKALSGELTTVRLTGSAGSAFDAGSAIVGFLK